MSQNALTFDGVYDIECASWDRFLCGEVLDADGNAEQHWSEDDFADALLKRSGVYFAHFGGRYDALWLLDVASRRGLDWSAKMRGAGILSARIGGLEVRDSHAIIPMSLAKAAGLAGARKTSPGLPCECGEKCGGFCALSRFLTPSERASVSDYLHNDCEVLLRVLEAVAARTLDEGIIMRSTIGGSAWATARAWLDLPATTHDLGRYKRLREGYFGGRTEVFRTRAPRGERYDIHSSYPAALVRVALPEGEGRFVRGSKLATAHYLRGHEGIYGATVTVPDCAIPPLPFRTTDRLLYPTGPMTGTWTALELRHAESMGARIESLTWAHAWPTSRPLLKEYAERVWQLRADAAESGDASWAAWYKWLANSLTGKLAQRPEHDSLDFEPADEDNDLPPELDRDIAVIRCIYGGAFVTHETSRVDACAHVQWAAYLTAEARVELHRQLCEAGPDALYCDTDSVYSRRELGRRIGPELGEWGHEGSMTDWRALAPKVYRYRDAKGEWHVRGKGMPGLTPRGFDALAEGEPWRVDRGVHGLRTNIRAHERLFRRRSLSRALHPTPGWCGGRELDRNGATRPTTVARYNERSETP